VESHVTHVRAPALRARCRAHLRRLRRALPALWHQPQDRVQVARPLRPARSRELGRSLPSARGLPPRHGTIAGETVAAQGGSASNGHAPVRAARAGSRRRRMVPDDVVTTSRARARPQTATNATRSCSNGSERLRAHRVPSSAGAGACRASSMLWSTGVGRASMPLRLSRTGNERCARPRSLSYRLRSQTFDDRLSQIGDRGCSQRGSADGEGVGGSPSGR